MPRPRVASPKERPHTVSLSHSSDDPYYVSEPARFLANTMTRLWGHEVRPDDTLTDRVVEVDTRHREIRVRPGLTPVRFHQWVNRAWLYTIGGAAWAPEFHTRPRLRLIVGADKAPTPRPLCESCRRAVENH